MSVLDPTPEPDDHRDTPAVPPPCPRCGGVHATMHDLAWPDDHDGDDYPRDTP